MLFVPVSDSNSRHYDLSLQFITQTGGEFALAPEARTIANLCSITIIHRVKEEAEKLADWFDTRWDGFATADVQSVLTDRGRGLLVCGRE